MQSVPIKPSYDSQEIDDAIFRLVNDEISLSSFKDALKIKIVLARLVYEVFRYDRRYDEARIELC